jgi:hypothetical protein
MSYMQFLAVLNLDEVGGLSAPLQDKLRVRMRELTERKVSVLKMFQETDQASDTHPADTQTARLLRAIWVGIYS